MNVRVSGTPYRLSQADHLGECVGKKKTKDMTGGPVKPVVKDPARNSGPPMGRRQKVPGRLVSWNFNQDAILNQDNAAHGIGQIILETADELLELQSSIDSCQGV